MTTKIISELIPAASYIRMSSDAQKDSPQRQRTQVQEVAARGGYQILREYSDHGLSGTEREKRLGYQELLKDAAAGLFSHVIVSEHSRMSREEFWDSAPVWKIFARAGIQIVTCNLGIIDPNTMMGKFQLLFGQEMAHDESRKIAGRSVTGKVNRALQGFRIGGTRVFGYDRQIVCDTGEVLTQVSFRRAFAKPDASQAVLVPSAEVEAVQAVQFMFDFVKNGGSLFGAARELNRRGIRTLRGKRFTYQVIQGMLQNPVYAGITRSGHMCCGKFNRMTDTTEPIIKEDTHEAIVDRETFDIVSGLVAGRGTTRDKWRQYLLSGLCRCQTCGGKMQGCTTKGYPYYYCHSGLRGGNHTQCKAHPSISANRLENAVVRAWCSVFLADGAIDQLKAPKPAAKPDVEKGQLKAVRAQIDIAEKNMALAAGDGPEEYRAVRGVWLKLRQQEADLTAAIARASQKQLVMPADIASDIEQLRSRRKQLEAWPNLKNENRRERLQQELAPCSRRHSAKSGLPWNLRRIRRAGAAGITRRSEPSFCSTATTYNFPASS